jgi:hypothetical protein
MYGHFLRNSAWAELLFGKLTCFHVDNRLVRHGNGTVLIRFTGGVTVHLFVSQTETRSRSWFRHVHAKQWLECRYSFSVLKPNCRSCINAEMRSVPVRNRDSGRMNNRMLFYVGTALSLIPPAHSHSVENFSLTHLASMVRY